MSITITRGDHNTAPESDFAGTVSVRHMRVDKTLSEAADRELGRAFTGSAWEAQRLGRILGGNLKLSEAFSTSDFKLAAFKELDTEMLRQYGELPAAWTGYCDSTLVSDFRPKRLVARNSSNLGLGKVPEGTEYPAGDAQTQTVNGITVGKYGRRKHLTWEAWLNNEAIDEFENIPGDLARQARETESVVAASNLLLVTGDGITKPYTATDVNTNFFKAGNSNAPTALPLTRDNLQTVLNGMAVKKVNGRLIAAPDLVLVVPKALEQTAISIVAPRFVRTEVVNGGTTTVTEMNNPLAGLTYVVEPMLDALNTHAKAAGTWFVVPKPGGPRPALWTAKLRGHEQPDLRVKADQGNAIGGGPISFDEGSFEVDTIEWRARHVFGAQQGDPLFAYASYGS